ncbi:hypothetical protein BDZ89DRAFT_1138565 [Hymenopellis radicata]|nr:hypothetical protein BDZ89DRAFT_1148373 [Hymenopellis radicata]KAF9020537.1 hypothetical protein BDZ89DRAFT_1138565 [Hymenopellis radicata]
MAAQTPHQTAYHKDLLADPDRVTALKNPDKAITIIDGKFGAVLTESPFIITTPNASWIPNPSRHPNEILQIRSDYLYGPEDYLLWPQEDVPEARWLPCLLRVFPQDGSLDDKLTILWDSLSPSQQFREDTNFRRGFGSATSLFAQDLEDCISVLDSTFSSSKFPPQTMEIVHRHTTTMSVISQTLRLTPLSLSRFSQQIRAFQRLGRQCVALNTFTTLVVPAAEGKVSHLDNRRFCEDYVGCFTFDVALGALLLRCGIPVWLLRDLSLVGHCRVDKLLPITYAKDMVVTSLPRPPVAPMWEGPRRGPGKIGALTSAIERNQGSFLSPANYSISGAARPQAILPAPSSSSRQTARPSTRGSPTKVMAYPTHTLLPAMASTWLHVAKVIDEQEYLQYCINKPAERYFVPRPDLFTNALQPKVASYLETWLRLRGIVLGCMSEGEPQALSHRAWRLWLDRGALEIEVTQGGKTVQRKNREKDEVDVLISAARKQGPVELAGEVMWKGRKFEFDGMVGPRHCREILWELNELGFRFEMCMLDSTLSTLASPRERYNRIRRCFPISHAPLELADLGQANQGLAHSDWFSRAPFVYALRHVMRFWRIDVVRAARWLTDEEYFKIDEKRGLSPADFEDFEYKVIKIYISAFLTVYGRTPRIPMILSHQPVTEWKKPVYHRMAVGPNGVWMPERESDELYEY